jgi:excisionase family DNA binding protein
MAPRNVSHQRTTVPSDLRFLTLREAARLLRVDHGLLRAARDAGELPVYRLGLRWDRVSVRDLRRWIASHRHGGGAATTGAI